MLFIPVFYFRTISLTVEVGVAEGSSAMMVSIEVHKLLRPDSLPAATNKIYRIRNRDLWVTTQTLHY